MARCLDELFSALKIEIAFRAHPADYAATADRNVAVFVSKKDGGLMP